MTPSQQQARTKRIMRMNRVLKKLFPTADIELNYRTPWELLVAVILSAQCTDKRVNIVTKHLFRRYKTVRAYAEADPREFEQIIFSCGFYRAKTRNIMNAARTLLKHFKGKVPDNMHDLLTVPGVARKTANVVLSNLFDVHEGIAVDTHVRRFAIRFDLSDYKDPVRIERDLMTLMPSTAWWGFNHRLVLYGRKFCPARPHECSEHPLTLLYPPATTIWPRAH